MQIIYHKYSCIFLKYSHKYSRGILKSAKNKAFRCSESLEVPSGFEPL